MPTTGKSWTKQTYIVYTTHNGQLHAAILGEKFAWMAMQGKHWIVEAQSKENAIYKAELLEMNELGVKENTEKFKNVVTKLKNSGELK